MPTRRRRRGRRRLTLRTLMKNFLAFIRWCKRPHWTTHLYGAAFVAAVITVWVLAAKFLWWLDAGTILILGPAVPLGSVALAYIIRAVRWVVGRVRVTRDAGIPLSPVRMVKELRAERAKFADADDRWALAMRAQKVIYDGRSPKLDRKQLNATGDVRASINLAGIGGNLDTITRLAADGTLAGIMHCREVSVQPTSRLGKAWITFYNSPPLNRKLTLADLPPSSKDRISFGIEESGSVAAVKYGLSILIGGTTGAGKSVLWWNMFADILRDNQPTEMFFVDPKKAELLKFKSLVGQRIGNIRIAGYCNTAAGAVPMMEQFAAEMDARQERMGEMGLTAITRPTEDFPVRIFVVDEMIDVIPAFAKSNSPMHIAISQGRATLDSVIGLSQLAKVEVLGSVRDLFPLRACLRTMTRQNTEAVLAITENDGVPCSRIPLATPGVGYYITDKGEVRKFRSAAVTDRQRSDLVAGKLPEGLAVNVEDIGPPCFVYLVPEKKATRIGYVGVAGGNAAEKHPVARRRAQHRRYDRVWCAEHDRVENAWNVHLDDTKLIVKKYPSRAAALIAEERLIKELRPRWNIQHNSANPLANMNLAKRAGMGRRLRDAAGEYRELGREHRIARRAVLAAAHQERVARLQEERDRFVQTVTQQ